MVIKKTGKETGETSSASTATATLAGRIAEGLRLPAEGTCPGERTRSTNARYGTLLSPLALALAETVERCPGIFPKDTLTGATLREEEARLGELSEARVVVAALLDQISSSQRASAERLTVHVSGALGTITATLDSPYTPAGVRAQLQVAAQKPLMLLAARREAKAQSARSTRLKNAEARSARAEAERSAEEARRLEEENRALRGEDVPRSPLSASAPAFAPRRASRRTPR